MLSKSLLDQLQEVLAAHDGLYQNDNLNFTDLLEQYQTAVKAVFEALSENWQYDAIVKLLATPRKEVEEGKRFYFSSETYGTGLYHLLDKRYDTIQIDQIDVDEKYQQRIKLQDDEVPGVLACLLTWHLAEVKEQLERAAQTDEDTLGNLDDHPF